MKLKSFYKECVRVFKITKKPTKTEYKAIMKIAGLGILIIGFMGFVIYILDFLIKLYW
ncbi:MAG: protein translocase SEC61 complex subunit gamma [Candidatus Nanoarchaeia archaeon]